MLDSSSDLGRKLWVARSLSPRFGRPTTTAFGIGIVLASHGLGCAETTCSETLSCHVNLEVVPIDSSFPDTGSRGDAMPGDASVRGDGDANAVGWDGQGGPADGGADIRVRDASFEQPPPCDQDGSPSTTSCLVDFAYGVFVSPTGLDSNDGSKRQPYGTLQAAIQFAAVTGARVYACNTQGPFVGKVTISAQQKGIRIYGGFDCDTWSANRLPTRLQGPAGDTPLYIQDTSSVHVEDFEFASLDAIQPGGSSIAAFVKSSEDIDFVRVSFTAGNAMAGADGEVGTNYETASAPNGTTPVGVNGGASVVCSMTCRDRAVSVGGKGGFGGLPAEPDKPATDGERGLPDLGATGEFDGSGGKAGVSCSTGIGHDGASAPPAPGGKGASGHGLLSAAGWSPEGGTAGATGGPGQGGGGGAGRLSSGGGSGACGGCGGAGGTGGKGGGSSFALLSYRSTIAFHDCKLTAGEAGRGGHGAVGQVGQMGGNGGATTPGCAGGGGGAGGRGGKGGGGAGGLSVGVGYVGAAPTRDELTTFRVAHGGLGGNPSDGISEDAGMDEGGITQDAAYDADGSADADTDAASDGGVRESIRGISGIARDELLLPSG